MNTRVFWDVDTQVDFMSPDGKLYVPGAEKLTLNLARLTDCAHANGIRILASADNHDANDEEISGTPDFKTTFPPHCLRGTAGQVRITETTLDDPLIVAPEDSAPEVLARLAPHPGDVLFHKRYFDVFTNPNVLPVLDALQVAEVFLYGVALDVCVRYAVEGLLAHRPHTAITLVTDAVRALEQDRGNRLLRDWQARSVNLGTAREILGLHGTTGV